METGHKHVEIEAKIRVGDLAEVEQKLKAAGARIRSQRVYERNVRYEDAHETLTPAARVLRLREDTQARLTYKEPQSAIDGVVTRTELEVTVSDFETTDLLLQKLGFHPAWIYEKFRTTYTLLGCEITLDELPFGPFVEVEGEPEAIERVLQTIGLGAAPRITASYSDLFFRARAALGLPFRDLTFDNFQGVNLPEELFK